MSVFMDSKRCSGCGLCIPVCPERRFVQTEKVVTLTGNRCMLCGHCQAACPSAAIKVDDLVIELGLHHIKEKKDSVDPGDFDCPALVQLMRSRRSCRNFLSRSVDVSLLEDLVRIGTTAPSGTNSQAWRFVILPTRNDVANFGDGVASFFYTLNRRARNPLLRFLTRVFHGDSLGRYYQRYWTMVDEALREWRECRVDRLFHGATAVIVVGGESSASCPAEDALLATQNILLAAHALGLGTCLIGFAVEAIRRDKNLKGQLQLGYTEEVYSVIALGYPDEKYCHPAGRKKVQPTIIHVKKRM